MGGQYGLPRSFLFVVGRVGVGCRYKKKIFSPVEFWCAVASRFVCFVGNAKYYGARGGAAD